MLLSLKHPASTRAASAASSAAQKRYRSVVQACLALLVVASAGGAITKPWGGWLSAIAFAGASIVTALATIVGWQRTWHDRRAVAEAGKTLSWRYGVGGAPFPLGDPGAGERYRDALQRLDRIEHPAPPATGLTPAELRSRDLDERRTCYRAGRLEYQVTWYRDRADELRRTARWWVIAAAALQVGGLAGAVLKGLDKTDVDWLALCATAAAAVVAWRAVGDDVHTARAYDLAANELEELGGRERQLAGEAAWAALVDDAECVMAGEHGVWVARRG